MSKVWHAVFEKVDESESSYPQHRPIALLRKWFQPQAHGTKRLDESGGHEPIFIHFGADSNGMTGLAANSSAAVHVLP
jgi:hypothetical protein